MTNDDKDLNQAVNTNQTIYRQPTTDYGPEDGNDKGMEPSVFLTKEGAIGFNHYGKCAVKSIKEWVEMAWNSRATPQQPSEPLKELDVESLSKFLAVDEGSRYAQDQCVWKVEPRHIVLAKAICSKFGQPSEKRSKAEAIYEAIKNAEVGGGIIIHNEDMSVWCVLNVVTKEHPERK